MTTITLPWPDARLSPNARNHWAVKSRAVSGARTYARYEALRMGVPPLPAEGEIALLVTFHPPDNRRRDRTNMEASMKSAFDGIADAWRVDDVRFAPTYRRGDPVRGGKVVVQVLL